VAVHDGRGEVDQLAVVGARALAEHLERLVIVDGMAFHQYSFGPLDQRPSAEGTLEVVILGESPQDDVDGALPVLDVVI
jgi:hypothetical protein